MYENIRIFTALPIPDAIRKLIKAKLPQWQSELLFSRWVHPEDWHITLHFISDTPPEALPLVEKALAAAAKLAEPFTLQLGRLSVFGRPEHPSVLWIGLKQQPEALTALHRAIGEHLSGQLGYTPEKRPYSPILRLPANMMAPARSRVNCLLQLT
ncbi:RNA 2',3'-cyclic phosphodiesterase [Paenibacillus protaetiae]|uniref:RNA 2',3'-cyclic phosphodiesterase n=1 Tax=Paenibacillus protaetiae TaxID=2509456 RepID=UPI0013EBBEB6|nr:RNA 2',3'-cyclic phosphodiesterase [Paenibacillus protaetiae]